MTRIILVFEFFVLSVASFSVEAQSPELKYQWPTNASRLLTSAFGEYRPRRYHGGIDIKTWGNVGYQVYAVRPGYVWRVSVSPFGYGKSLYVKLDTGEIAVYAHLSRFSHRIDTLVEKEQQRQQKYSVNMFFKAGQIPVAQGEIVAFTGQTGIGAPHLHFEIRDAANRPTNPLLKGYVLPDNVKPVIRRVSLSPLDAKSEVNGDFRPVILEPQWVRSGEYAVTEPISLWGNVGLAVSAFDKDSNSSNRFGVYELRLFVDDVLRFRYRFDRMDFQTNDMIEIERDYLLSRRDFGKFYKLYKDEGNVRSHYEPNRTWAGALKSASLVTTPSLTTKAAPVPAGSDYETGVLFPGQHKFRIEVADFFGNTSIVRGEFHVGATFRMTPIVNEHEGNRLAINDVLTYDLTRLRNLRAAYRLGRRWQPLDVIAIDEDHESSEKGGGAEISTEFEAVPKYVIEKPGVSDLILKLEAEDQFGAISYPYFHWVGDGADEPEVPVLDVSYDFYKDYLRLEVSSANALSQVPEVTLYPGSADSLLVTLHQVSLQKYLARIELAKLRGQSHILQFVIRDSQDQTHTLRESFEAQRIDPPHATRLSSDDGNFWVDFWPGSLFGGPIYGRATVDSVYRKDHLFVGNIYDAEPQDVVLDGGGRVFMRYPAEETEPRKLGVYYQTKRRWVFIENDHNPAQRTISARVLSLEKFALLKDDTAPAITGVRPRNGARLRDTTPRISVNVWDELSGIDSEEDIDIRLNGRRVIAEYDPERRRILYDVREPLPQGEYRLSIRAYDKVRNLAVYESAFWIN